jgi:hypothetical protein
MHLDEDVSEKSKLIYLCAAYCEKEKRSALEKIFKEKLEQERNKLEQSAVRNTSR